MKYLVLGSSGQIGKPLCHFLTKQGHEVLEFDILRSPEEDLRIRSQFLEEQIKRADFVFFLAFDVGGANYLKAHQTSFEFVQNNALIMANVFDILRLHKKPFIFTSSQMSAMTHSPYGVAKAMGEAYTNALNGIIVKLWNVYGPEDCDEERTHVVTDFIRRATNSTECFKIQTTGQEERQFLYVEDCCAALYALSCKYNELSRGEEYHITSFRWIKIYDLANMISHLTHAPFRVDPSATDSVQGVKCEPRAYPITMYWRPETTLEEGLKNVLAYERAKNSGIGL